MECFVNNSVRLCTFLVIFNSQHTRFNMLANQKLELITTLTVTIIKISLGKEGKNANLFQGKTKHIDGAQRIKVNSITMWPTLITNYLPQGFGIERTKPAHNFMLLTFLCD